MKYVALAIGIVAILFVASFTLRMCGNAADTASKEFAPSALLAKYEWFKDAGAQLDKKSADVWVYNARISVLEKAYIGVQRKDWPRDDREQMGIWESELSGVKASYNDLAAQYNADMAKFNYRFCNRGQLPQGADTPLPREYKPYINE